MQQWYNRVITGEAAGVIPAVLRWLLSVVAMMYGQVMYWRNVAYDRGWKRITRLPVPVISVGNVTTGGSHAQEWAASGVETNAGLLRLG